MKRPPQYYSMGMEREKFEAAIAWKKDVQKCPGKELREIRKLLSDESKEREMQVRIEAKKMFSQPRFPYNKVITAMDEKATSNDPSGNEGNVPKDAHDNLDPLDPSAQGFSQLSHSYEALIKSQTSDEKQETEPPKKKKTVRVNSKSTANADASSEGSDYATTVPSHFEFVSTWKPNPLAFDRLEYLADPMLPPCKTTLVICPVVALTQWKHEFQRHVTPGSLKVGYYYGPDRNQISVEELMSYDVILTTYSVVEAEWRKTIAPTRSTCPYCSRVFQPHKLTAHLRWYCGPNAKKSEAQAKQVRKSDLRKGRVDPAAAVSLVDSDEESEASFGSDSETDSDSSVIAAQPPRTRGKKVSAAKKTTTKKMATPGKKRIRTASKGGSVSSEEWSAGEASESEIDLPSYDENVTPSRASSRRGNDARKKSTNNEPQVREDTTASSPMTEEMRSPVKTEKKRLRKSKADAKDVSDLFVNSESDVVPSVMSLVSSSTARSVAPLTEKSSLARLNSPAKSSGIIPEASSDSALANDSAARASMFRPFDDSDDDEHVSTQPLQFSASDSVSATTLAAAPFVQASTVLAEGTLPTNVAENGHASETPPAPEIDDDVIVIDDDSSVEPMDIVVDSDSLAKKKAQPKKGRKISVAAATTTNASPAKAANRRKNANVKSEKSKEPRVSTMSKSVVASTSSVEDDTDSDMDSLGYEVIITETFEAGKIARAKSGARVGLNSRVRKLIAESKRELGPVSALHRIHWRRLVLDEAHFIKSRNSSTTQACYYLQSERRWCLSGTPIQNRLTELFSIIRFLRIQPYTGFMCKNCPCKCLDLNVDYETRRCNYCDHPGIRHYNFMHRYFNTGTQTAFGSLDDPIKMDLSHLRNCITEFTLRRTKTGRAAADISLPHRHVVIRKDITLNRFEQDVYSALYSNSKLQLDAFTASGTVLHNYAHLFDALIRLRQAVSHPFLVIHSRGRQVVSTFGTSAQLTNGPSRDDKEDDSSVAEETNELATMMQDYMGDTFTNLEALLDDGEAPVSFSVNGLPVPKNASSAGSIATLAVNAVIGVCGICREALDDAVTSQCHHSFCRHCVSEYILAIGGSALCKKMLDRTNDPITMLDLERPSEDLSLEDDDTLFDEGISSTKSKARGGKGKSRGGDGKVGAKSGKSAGGGKKGKGAQSSEADKADLPIDPDVNCPVCFAPLSVLLDAPAENSSEVAISTPPPGSPQAESVVTPKKEKAQGGVSLGNTRAPSALRRSSILARLPPNKIGRYFQSSTKVSSSFVLVYLLPSNDF